MAKQEREVSKHGMSFSEIGKVLGVSRERAQQIYAIAIQKLSHPKFKDNFFEIMEIMDEINRHGGEAHSGAKIFN